MPGRKRRLSSPEPASVPKRLAIFDESKPTVRPIMSRRTPAVAELESIEQLTMAMERLTIHTPTGFVDLPNELQLAILAHLPVRDIVRARRVDIHIRDLIDEPHNFVLLYLQAQKQEKARLEAEVEFCCNYRDIDFLEALRRFCERKGIHSDRSLNNSNLQMFARHWNTQHDPLTLGLGQTPSPPLLSKLLASLMINSYRVHVGLPAVKSKTPWSLGSQVLTAFFNDHRGLSRQWTEQVTRNKLFHKAPLDPSWMAAKGTPLDRIYRVDDTTDTYSLLKAERHTAQAKLLKIPCLPDHRHSFGYWVRSSWAYGLIEKYRDGGAMSEIERLAVVQEIFLQ